MLQRIVVLLNTLSIWLNPCFSTAYTGTISFAVDTAAASVTTYPLSYHTGCTVCKSFLDARLFFFFFACFCLMYKNWLIVLLRLATFKHTLQRCVACLVSDSTNLNHFHTAKNMLPLNSPFRHYAVLSWCFVMAECVGGAFLNRASIFITKKSSLTKF